MDNIIKLKDFKKINRNDLPDENIDLSFDQVKKLENLRDGIEKLLNTATTVHGEPLGVGLAAGRYAAMKLYQMHGRAETMAFFNSCIETVEMAEDILVK